MLKNFRLSDHTGLEPGTFSTGRLRKWEFDQLSHEVAQKLALGIAVN